MKIVRPARQGIAGKSSRSKSLLCALWGLAFLLAPVSSAGAVGADTGYAQFVKSQSDVAKKATRSKDWATAEAAWTAILEVDPLSLDAMAGLADVAAQRGDLDAEALARREYNKYLTYRVQSGENKLARKLSKSRDRLAEIDPFPGEAEELLSDFSKARAELAQAYLEADLFANSLKAWITRLDTVPPDSVESAEALTAIARCLAEGDDFVGRLGLAPDLSAGDRDAAWIADFDRKTTPWSRAGEWKTPHYRIKVAGNWRLGQAAARAMERAHAFYREVWGIIPDPEPKRVDKTLRDINITPIAVNIYETHAVYLKRSGAVEWSGGQFTGSSVDTYDHGNGSGSWRSTLTTLYHEASHQFMSDPRSSTRAWPACSNRSRCCPTAPFVVTCRPSDTSPNWPRHCVITGRST